MAEPRSSRWRRRAMTIPTMLGITAVAFLALPLLMPLAIIADLVRLRFRLPTVRVYLFLLQYVFNDSAEIVLAPVYWLMAGAGTRLDTVASIDRHQRLQWWSVRLLVKRAEQLLGMRIDVRDEDRAALTPGPVIVISRHVSLFDASLPGLLYQAEGYSVRGVIMAELLADPGFDLIYGRLGSVFIPRDRGPEALAEIERMASAATDDTAFVIFPEGRLFHPKVRDRLMARIEDADSARAERLSALTGMLPPKAGGFQALLATVPDADVVIVGHRGLDRFKKLTDLTEVVPVREPVRVTARRIARDDIPHDPEEQARWLDETWLEMDADLARPLVDGGR